MPEKSQFVFLVVDSRFGAVAAFLDLGEAATELSKQAAKEADSSNLGNPGSFRIQRVPLGMPIS